jgi:hypothetical protein
VLSTNSQTGLAVASHRIGLSLSFFLMMMIWSILCILRIISLLPFVFVYHPPTHAQSHRRY